MKISALSLVMLVALAGCASTANYSATQDKSAGKILVSYETETLQNPPLSPKHANHVATQRCQMIGHSYTERNVHVTHQCSATDSTGTCAQWQVEKAYQCAGNAIADPQSQPVAIVITAP